MPRTSKIPSESGGRRRRLGSRLPPPETVGGELAARLPTWHEGRGPVTDDEALAVLTLHESIEHVDKKRDTPFIPPKALPGPEVSKEPFLIRVPPLVKARAAARAYAERTNISIVLTEALTAYAEGPIEDPEKVHERSAEFWDRTIRASGTPTGLRPRPGDVYEVELEDGIKVAVSCMGSTTDPRGYRLFETESGTDFPDESWERGTPRLTFRLPASSS